MPFGTFFHMFEMKRTTITLYVGIIHQNDGEEDFADIRFLTTTKEEAKSELLKVKEYAIKQLKLKCVADREDYLLLKSIDESITLEAYYIERILIMRGGNNEK